MTMTDSEKALNKKRLRLGCQFMVVLGSVLTLLGIFVVIRDGSSGDGIALGVGGLVVLAVAWGALRGSLRSTPIQMVTRREAPKESDP
jgi:hypothetical protein